MSIAIVLICIVILILLITWGKINAFLAFLIVSILAGVFLKLPAEKDHVINSAWNGRYVRRPGKHYLPGRHAG